MTEIIPILAPAWLWILAVSLLVLAFVSILILACCVWRVASVLDGAAKMAGPRPVPRVPVLRRRNDDGTETLVSRS